MSVIDALVAHHAILRQLYQQSETNPDVFDEFIRHLVVHHTMEEKYFYDILQTIDQAHMDALEAVNEHHIIEMIIKDSQRFPRDHEQFIVKVEGLGEYTSHHLDEEEAQIFPMAAQLFPAEDLNILGRLFLDAKEKLLGVVLPEVPQTIASRAGKTAKTAKTTVGGATAGNLRDTAIGLGIGSLRK
jgi:hemerythrin-like domain-containing protein